MARIYVASSWRNKYFPEVVTRLREAGHEVYDFRNPPHGGAGFHWTDIDPDAPNWTYAQYAEGLHHPLAERQFQADIDALTWAGWPAPASASSPTSPKCLNPSSCTSFSTPSPVVWTSWWGKYKDLRPNPTSRGDLPKGELSAFAFYEGKKSVDISSTFCDLFTN